MPAIAALDGIRGRRELPIIEEREGLFEIVGEQRLERLADFVETTDTGAQAGEFGQGGFRPAAAIKQPVDHIHNVPQGA